MIIKVCGVTRAADVLEAAEAGADALGFNFWPKSPRYVDPARAAELVAATPAGVVRVGVFVDESLERIEEIMQLTGIEIAQIHGSPPRRPGFRHWLARTAGEAGLRETLEAAAAEAAVIDAPAGEQRGGTGRTFDWSLAAGLPGRIILAGGLGPDNIQAALSAARPWGVDACSRLESAPGIKDPWKVAAFVRAAREWKA